MKRFALIGAAGYIAPRHMRAIMETGNELIAAMDVNDSVGVLDNYFPSAEFFTDIKKFRDFLNKSGIDYLSVCTPNNLHVEHIRLGLNVGADVISEKPVVIEPADIDGLVLTEKKEGRRVFTIMQLRLHPSILELKRKIADSDPGRKFDVSLKYFTPRGKWYHSSWKGDLSKSGGVATNIGIHFFDLLTWIFGNVSNCSVFSHTADVAAGELKLEKADVKWQLSIRPEDLPGHLREAGKRVYRSLVIDGKEIEFSDKMEDLHVASYGEILGGKGFTLEECRKSIELAHQIRKSLT